MPNLKPLWLLFFLALNVCGCVGATERYPSDQAQDFFQAANEANFQGVYCQSPQHVDLSAYSPYLGIKYPPTDRVDLLSAPPSRPYQCFAVLEGAAAASNSGTIPPEVLAQFIAKAKAIGADALILPPSQGNSEGDAGRSQRRLEAAAIKYRLEITPEKKRSP
jgi:hypothetical protein